MEAERIAVPVTSPQTLYVSFSNTAHSLCVGTSTGFRVFSTERCKLLLARQYHASTQPNCSNNDALASGVSNIQVFGSSNLFAIVKGGHNRDELLIWDDLTATVPAKISFSAIIRNVKLFKNWAVVMFASKIQVFQILPKPSKLYELETYWNGAQIVDIAGDLNSCILATCSRAQGQVKVIELGSAKGKHRPYTNIIAAHTSHLVCIAVSPNGTYIATASRTGTLIRIFGARTGILHHELRRGADNATIYSLAFDRDSERLCAVSDTGTLHVFLLTVGTHNADTANRQSAFNPVQTVLPKYFSSDWSFAFMSLPKPTKSLVRFSNSDPAYIYAACADGGLYKFHYDLVNGKQGSLVSFRRFDIDADGL